MLQEIVVTRTEASYAPEVLQWSDHGQLSVVGNRDLTVLDPTIGKTQIFEINRLRQLLDAQSNDLENAIPVGDDQSVQSFPEIRVTRAFWSPGGVSKTAGCTLVALTNTTQALILEKEDSWRVVDDFSQILKRRFKIDFETFVRASDFERVRVRAFAWSDGIPGMEIPATCFAAVGTGSREVLLYRYSAGFTEETVVTLEMPDPPKDIKWSPWVKHNGVYLSYLLVVSETNTCVLRKVIFTDKLCVDSEERVISGPSRKLVSVSQWLAHDGRLFLCTTSTSLLTVTVIDDTIETHLLALEGYRAVTNIALFYSLGLNAILSNSTNSLTFVQFIDGKFSKNSVCYATESTTPITGLTEEIKTLQKGPDFKILGLTTNASKNLLAFTYVKCTEDSLLSQHNTWRLEFSLKIVPLLETADWTSVLLDTTTYPCRRYSPLFRIQQLELFKAYGINNQITEKLGNIDQISVSTHDSNFVRALQTQLFDSIPISKQQLRHVFSGPPEFVQTKAKILAVIAEIIVSHFDLSLLTHAVDIMIYKSMLAMLGREMESPGEVVLEDPEFQLSETFSFDNFNVQSVISNEAHQWARCDFTLLPLMSPRIYKCTFCNAKLTASEDRGEILKDMRRALVLCPYCGAGFSSKY